jgi:hypothetical protein
MVLSSFVPLTMLALQVSAAPPTAATSICDVVAHHQQFVGKRISIDAAMLFTPHGMYLLSNSCSRTDLPDKDC